MTEDQYFALWNRRQGSDNLTWQVPSLSIAGQAFLLNTAMDPNTIQANATVLSFVSALIGIVSVHSMLKHRYFERNDSKLLAKYERARAADGFAELHDPERGGPVEGAAYKPPGSAANWWILMVCGFVVLALFICVQSIFAKTGGQPVTATESIVNPTKKVDAENEKGSDVPAMRGKDEKREDVPVAGHE